jgi:hypothetical protein
MVFYFILLHILFYYSILFHCTTYFILLQYFISVFYSILLYDRLIFPIRLLFEQKFQLRADFRFKFASKSVKPKEHNAILHTRPGSEPPKHLLPWITFVEFIQSSILFKLKPNPLICRCQKIWGPPLKTSPIGRYRICPNNMGSASKNLSYWSLQNLPE